MCIIIEPYFKHRFISTMLLVKSHPTLQIYLRDIYWAFLTVRYNSYNFQMTSEKKVLIAFMSSYYCNFFYFQHFKKILTINTLTDESFRNLIFKYKYETVHSTLTSYKDSHVY